MTAKRSTHVGRCIGLGLIVAMLVGCSDNGSGSNADAIGDNSDTPVDADNLDGDVGDDNTNSSTGTGVLPDLSQHATRFEGLHYSGSDNCSVCHDDMQDAEGNDVSIGRDWSASLMAQAARDPYWIAKVAAEINKAPGRLEELNDTCSRCHAPMANDAAKKDGFELDILGDSGLFTSANPYFDHAMDGVSCTLCHQISDSGVLGTESGTSGQFTVQQYSDLSQRPAYGQYENPDDRSMVRQSNFDAVQSDHISTSGLCASCHDLSVPILDASGNPVPGFEGERFSEQMIYTEWTNSDYRDGGTLSQSCQGCHMPTAEGSLPIASQGGGIPRSDVSRHNFLGANTVMQTLLKNFRQELGIAVLPIEFDRSIENNRAFLKTAATISITSAELINNRLLIDVRVDNTTGHKLPSGYPSRRVYVHLKVVDDAGVTEFESGRVNEDGSVDGLATDSDSQLIEPHYNEITSADQVQVYEAIMEDDSNGVTHSLVNAVTYKKDNRLLPKGLFKNSIPYNIQVIGEAVNDSDFNAGSDNITYRLTLAEDKSYNVLVELRYQPLAFGHLQDLFKSIRLVEVDQFKTMFDATLLRTEIIASDTKNVAPAQ